ncbi:OLC1v1036205C1, partial [Oldenlandia corymbosa var. corymbosa]
MVSSIDHKASSSGLSTKEKQDTPIDLADQSPSNPSSGKRRVSKEKLATILENSKEEKKSETWDAQESKQKLEDESGLKQRVVVCKQLAVYVPNVDFSLRFAVVEELTDDQGLDNAATVVNEEETRVDGILEFETENDLEGDENIQEEGTLLMNNLLVADKRATDDTAIGSSS